MSLLKLLQCVCVCVWSLETLHYHALINTKLAAGGTDWLDWAGHREVLRLRHSSPSNVHSFHSALFLFPPTPPPPPQSPFPLFSFSPFSLSTPALPPQSGCTGWQCLCRWTLGIRPRVGPAVTPLSGDQVTLQEALVIFRHTTSSCITEAPTSLNFDLSVLLRSDITRTRQCFTNMPGKEKVSFYNVKYRCYC